MHFSHMCKYREMHPRAGKATLISVITKIPSSSVHHSQQVPIYIVHQNLVLWPHLATSEARRYIALF
jgi:hypothetical protein